MVALMSYSARIEHDHVGVKLSAPQIISIDSTPTLIHDTITTTHDPTPTPTHDPTPTPTHDPTSTRLIEGNFHGYPTLDPTATPMSTPPNTAPIVPTIGVTLELNEQERKRENMYTALEMYVPSRTIEAEVFDPDCSREKWRSPSLDSLIMERDPATNFNVSILGNRYLFDTAEVVQNATSWWSPEEKCQDDCCVSTFLVPVKKTETALLSAQTYVDIADLVLGFVKWPGRDKDDKTGVKGFRHFEFDARMIPLLQPGTVIYLQMGIRKDENPPKFIAEHSRNIKVPHIVVIGNHDSELQPEVLEYLDEPGSTLAHIFTVNPSPDVVNHPKITIIPIGMSTYGTSNLIIQQVVKARGYTNPFESKQLRKCWAVNPINARPKLSYRDRHGDRHIKEKIVKWWGANIGYPWDLSNDHSVLRDGMKLHRKSELPAWIPKDRGGSNGSPGRLQRPLAVAMACENNTDNLTFCSAPVKTMDLITVIDKLRFGISPEGQGHDCYRTWEYLSMGMIPVTQKADWTGNLYDGLPVLELASFNISHAEFKHKLETYVASKEFSEADFDGWPKLFAKYWWDQVMSTTLVKKTVTDPSGHKYFTKYHYSCKNQILQQKL